MNKTEFLSRLRINLCGASEQDVKTAEDFYCEMIDDRVESGMSEQEAVDSLGSPEDAAKNILLEMPLGKLIKVKAKRSRRHEALPIHPQEEAYEGLRRRICDRAFSLASPPACARHPLPLS